MSLAVECIAQRLPSEPFRRTLNGVGKSARRSPTPSFVPRWDEVGQAAVMNLDNRI